MIEHEKNALEYLCTLVDKESLQFVMKAGVIIAYNILRKDELPKEPFAKQVLSI